MDKRILYYLHCRNLLDFCIFIEIRIFLHDCIFMFGDIKIQKTVKNPVFVLLSHCISNNYVEFILSYLLSNINYKKDNIKQKY